MKYPTEGRQIAYYSELWMKEGISSFSKQEKINWWRMKVTEIQHLKNRLDATFNLMQQHLEKLDTFDGFFAAVMACLHQYQGIRQDNLHISFLSSCIQFLYAYINECYLTARLLSIGDLNGQSKRRIRALCNEKSKETHEFEYYPLLLFGCSVIQLISKAFWTVKDSSILQDKDIKKFAKEDKNVSQINEFTEMNHLLSNNLYILNSSVVSFVIVYCIITHLFLVWNETLQKYILGSD